MACSYKFDKKNKVVRITVPGKDTYKDQGKRLIEITGDPAWSKDCNVIVDLSAVTDFDISSEDRKDIIKQQQSRNSIIGKGKMAIVAQDGHTFGMSRMFELLSKNKTKMKTRIFREMIDAEKWLKISTS